MKENLNRAECGKCQWSVSWLASEHLQLFSFLIAIYPLKGEKGKSLRNETRDLDVQLQDPGRKDKMQGALTSEQTKKL